MTDLIKREDALAALTLGDTMTVLQNRIRALPAVTTHRYAGESEASVYDRKGFPPIEIATSPIDPAAIREAALDKLDKAVEALREIEADCDTDYPPSHGAIKHAIRTTLAELEGK